jgi:hypothetical protein
MKDQLRSTCPVGSGEPDDDGGTAPPPHSPADLEETRIGEYRQESLERPDPLQAVLGAANSGLMEVFHRYCAAIDRRMGPEPSLDQLRKLTLHLEMCLKLARQIDRYAQFELRHFRSPPPPPANPIPVHNSGEESNT